MQNASSRVVTREKVKPGIWRRRSAKKKGWTYEITFRDSTGAQKRQTVPGGLRDAEAELAKIKARMASGERVAPDYKLTFATASEKWLDAKSPNLAEKTIRAYRYGLDRHLLPALGRKRLQDIDVTVVAQLVARMGTVEYRRELGDVDTDSGYSVQTIKSVLIPLSCTFAYASRHLGFGGQNPVTALDLDERPGYRQHKKPKKKLGREELDLLIQHAESPYREIIATAIALGTRIGETTGIAWRCVDFDAGTVLIEQQANAKREIARLKTESSRRRIEAPDWLMAMFRELKIRSPFCGDDDLVFPTRTGRPHGHGNVLGRGLYPALKRAGLPQTSFHSLRHSHASLWIKDGGDIITLSKRLGHASPSVTMSVYANEIEEANDHALRKARVNAMFSRTSMARLLA